MGIVVPPEVVAALGKGKRPPVMVTVGTYTYRSTVAVMGGEFLIGIAAEHRQHLPVAGADTLWVTLTLDDRPRITPVPDDLQAALHAASLRDAFDALAPSKRKERVRQVEDAKTEATRQKRIQKVIDTVQAKA